MKVFPFCPTGDAKLKYSWKTDVQTTKRSQQRIALRKNPIFSFEETYQFDANDGAEVYHTLSAWRTEPIYVPNWHEVARIRFIQDENRTIFIDETYYSFDRCKRLIMYADVDLYYVFPIRCLYTNGVGLLYPYTYYESNADMEEFRISNYFVNRDSVLRDRLENHDFTKGGLLMPLEEVYIKGNPSFKAIKSGRTELSIEFVKRQPKDYNFTLFEDRTFRSEYLPYEGSPLMPYERFEKDYGSRTIKQEIDLTDDAVGPVTLIPEVDFLENTRKITIKDNSPVERFSTIKLMYELRGKQKSFWLPSYTKDFTLHESFYGMNFSNTAVSILFDSRLYLDTDVFDFGKYSIVQTLLNLRDPASDRNNRLQTITHGFSGVRQYIYNTLTDANLKLASDRVNATSLNGTTQATAAASQIVSYFNTAIADGKNCVLIVFTDGRGTTISEVSSFINALGSLAASVPIYTVGYTNESLENLNGFNTGGVNLPKPLPSQVYPGFDPTISRIKLRVRRMQFSNLLQKNLYLHDMSNYASWPTKIVGVDEDVNGLARITVNSLPPTGLFNVTRTVVSTLEKYRLDTDNVSIECDNYFESKVGLSCARVPDQ